MQTHTLKTWSEFFHQVLSGAKTFELRYNDRNFTEGDILVLNDFDNTTQEYTGNCIKAGVTYVLTGGKFGLDEKHVILGIRLLSSYFKTADEWQNLEYKTNDNLATVLGKSNYDIFEPGRKITLCGSTKYKNEFERADLWLTLKGCIVYSVAAFGHADKKLFSKDEKLLLDKVHKEKIKNSDLIFVVDVDSYIGDSTKSEIDYAKSLNKPIIYWSEYF